MPGQGPTRDSPHWIAYSLRDVRTARAGQIPSMPYLVARGPALKPVGEIFQPQGKMGQGGIAGRGS